MDKRNGYLIAIILTSLFCAFPGLVLLCGSTLVTIVYSTEEVNRLTNPLETAIFISMLVCSAVLGLAGLLTPVVITLVMRRQTIKESRQPPPDWNEPIPPPA
jgi:ABC-type Fe3+ transport system permease subunit